MHRASFLLVCLFVAVSSVMVSAQSASSGPHFANDPAMASAAVSDLDAAVFEDAESQAFFIDFESLDVNVNYVLVKNREGDVIWKDRVFDLPVDTIYEIDCSAYQPGRYTVEVQTFTSVLRKDIEVATR